MGYGGLRIQNYRSGLPKLVTIMGFGRLRI